MNLVVANHVLFADRWFNPTVHEQATDRTHRIGQTREVHVEYLDAKDTFDEVMKEVLLRKSTNATVVLADQTEIGIQQSKINYSEVAGEMRSLLLLFRARRMGMDPSQFAKKARRREGEEEAPQVQATEVPQIEEQAGAQVSEQEARRLKAENRRRKQEEADERGRLVLRRRAEEEQQRAEARIAKAAEPQVKVEPEEPPATNAAVIVLQDSDDEDMPLQQMWQRRDSQEEAGTAALPSSAAAANPAVQQEDSPWGCTPAAPPRPMGLSTGSKAAPSPAERLRELIGTAAEQRKYPKEEEEEAVICLD